MQMFYINGYLIKFFNFGCSTVNFMSMRLATFFLTPYAILLLPESDIIDVET